MQPTTNISLQKNRLENLNEIEKPCLVQAKQGFSVYYQQKYLYSKYSPSSAIERALDNCQIAPGTFVLACSPLLGYGIEKLISKIDESSMVLAIETDPLLYDFSHENSICSLKTDESKNFFYEKISSMKDLLEFLNRPEIIKRTNNCRRLLSMDFSAIESSSKVFYSQTANFITKCISQFWKNRVTISRLGKLYNKNIFNNLPYICKSKNLIKNSIEKPILVFGAGPSTDDFFEKTKLS
ncbi:MAG: hypothetical protein K6A43_13315, partial [Treponema sp.]|nr:hypothetical protein [Treponema sp.]